jgi:acylphosphatase
MAQDPVRRHVVVTGRVQGVFFRDSVRRLAEARGVAGWACNRPDGSVEAVFEGTYASVLQLVAFCLHGPPGAHVEAMTQTEEPPEGLPGFSVR